MEDLLVRNIYIYIYSKIYIYYVHEHFGLTLFVHMLRQASVG